MSRILACPIPENINPLSPNGFMFSIERLPEVTYFCQEVSIPSITLGTAEVSTPFIQYANPGDMMQFSELTVQFMVDSKMINYKSIFNWLRGLGFPENNKQYTDQILRNRNTHETAATLSDATLTVLGNDSKPVQTVKFIDCFPISLESLTFTSTSQDVQYLIGNATFKYSYYIFE